MRRILFYLGYFYYLLLVKTARIKLTGFEQVQEFWKNGKNVVFCCPHNAILACFVGVDSLVRPNVVLISSLSGDGELVAKLLIKRRFEMIRGSSSRGGKKALLELQKAGKLGKSLGVAFDGPKGPPFVPNSWDRFLIPLPFCEISVCFEKIPEKQELNIQDDLKYEDYVLENVQKRATELYSHIYHKK